MEMFIVSAVALLVLVIIAFIFFQFGWLWIEANSCGADVTMYDLITMPLRGVNARKLVTAKIMGCQSGIDADRKTGLSTKLLESHMLAGGTYSLLSLPLSQRDALNCL